MMTLRSVRTLVAVPLVCAATLVTPLAAQDDEKAVQAEPFKVDYGKRPAEEDCRVARWGPKSFTSPKQALFAAKVVTVTGDPIHEGVVLVENGKIVGVGPARDLDVPEGFAKVELGEAWLLPGFVDLHCHIAGNGFDLNDSVHATNPEMRTLDLIGLDHPQVKTALQGGVTTVLYIPGSGSNCGGFGTLTKTAGRSVEDALVRFPGSMKVAQAGNPERRSGDMGTGRIGMNFGLRAMLERGRAYWKSWEDYDAGKRTEKPQFEADLEYLRGLFRHEYPVSVHTQGYQVCLETLRELHDEFGLWVFVDHGTYDAYRLSGEARARGLPVCNGPRQYRLDRDSGRMLGLAGLWARGGQHGFSTHQLGLGPDGIAINTDSPVVPQEELSVQASVAVRLGLPDAWAIRALTINPARFVGADHRVGSIEKGKDADLVVWTGDPLDPRNWVRRVMVNGTIYYNCDPGGAQHGKRKL